MTMLILSSQHNMKSICMPRGGALVYKALDLQWIHASSNPRGANILLYHRFQIYFWFLIYFVGYFAYA